MIYYASPISRKHIYQLQVHLVLSPFLFHNIDITNSKFDVLNYTDN